MLATEGVAIPTPEGARAKLGQKIQPESAKRTVVQTATWATDQYVQLIQYVMCERERTGAISGLGAEALSLEAYDSGDSFFLIFADLTTGETTYPSGRYLYADKPGPDGITILDFNKAHSPPCAFTNFATCPLPTRQNRMTVAIEAGEKYSKGK